MVTTLVLNTLNLPVGVLTQSPVIAFLSFKLSESYTKIAEGINLLPHTLTQNSLPLLC